MYLYAFRPKKLIRTTEDSFFSNEFHVLSDVGKKADNICKYDLDDLDAHWLAIFNERREDLGMLNFFTRNIA